MDLMELFGGAIQGRLNDQNHVNLIGIMIENLREESWRRGILRGKFQKGQGHTYSICSTPTKVQIFLSQEPVKGFPTFLYFESEDDRADANATSLAQSGYLKVRDDESTIEVYCLEFEGHDVLHNPEVSRNSTVNEVNDILRNIMDHKNKYMHFQGHDHLISHVDQFFQDHGPFENNVFLMMRFSQSDQHTRIHKVIKEYLGARSLNVLRADDKDYTGDLWNNVELYMNGCKYGIAVFEDIDARDFNPNVALEVGYMYNSNKRVLLLKEQRLPHMPTDVVGKLYKPFDSYNIEKTISEQLERWISDIGFVPTTNV